MAVIPLPLLGTSAAEAAWLLIPALPVSLYVAWSDMKSMKIPNRAVYALAIGFALFGLIAFWGQLDAYLWRWSHLVVILIVGILLNLARLVGAGDAKFAAAAAPYVALQDWRFLIFVYAACFLATYALHRLARHTSVRKLAPEWQSWSTGKRFPMGLALGATLVTYLGLAVLHG